MAFEANANELSLLRGAILFDRFDASGNSTGFRFIGDCSKCELTPSVTIKEAFEHTTAASNKIASIPTQQKHALSIDMMETFNPDNAAIAMLGEASSLTQVTPLVITAEAVTSAATVGRYYELQCRQVSNYVVKSGSTVLVEGKDYSFVRTDIGLFTILPGSAAAGNAITVDYDSPVLSYSQVAGGKTPNIRGRVRFLGDPATGPVVDVIFRNVQFTPSAAISFLTDDFASGTLAGECLVDNNFPDSPLYLLTRTGVVAGS